MSDVQLTVLTPSLSVGSVSGAPSEVVQPSDGRASLLESIRNAGGIGKAKLRNVKERKMEKKKQKEQEQGEGWRNAARCLRNGFKVQVG